MAKASSAPGFLISVNGTILCLMFTERWMAAKSTQADYPDWREASLQPTLKGELTAPSKEQTG